MTESSRRATCHTRSPRHDRETRLLRALFGDHVIVAVGDLAVHQLAHLLGHGIGLWPGRVLHGLLVALELGDHQGSFGRSRSLRTVDLMKPDASPPDSAL